VAGRGKRKKPKKPHFPRRLWTAGQKPRVEKLKKGKGSYDRGREGRTIRKEVQGDLGGG